MNKTRNHFFNKINVTLAVTYLCISVFIYRGFFFPDQTIFGINPIAKIISTLIKIIFPIAAVSLILLYRAVYLKRVAVSSIILLLLSLIIIMFIIYPAADHFYKKRFIIDSSRYHTFLQLTPPVIENIDTSNINVFCLGGSTTEFPDKLGREWSALVEQNLKDKNPNFPIKFYNQGKQWYTTQHSLTNYIQNVRHYKPDVIIFMHNINDLLLNADFSRFSNGEFRTDYGHFLGPEAFMLKYGSLFGFIMESLKLLWYNDKVEEINTEYFPGLVSFERNIKTVNELSIKDGTKLILMTQPNLYKDSITPEEFSTLNMLISEAIGNGKKWTYKTALSGIRQYNDKIREIAARDSIMLIDLDRIVPKTLEYFYDDVHYRPKAIDLITEHVSYYLQQLFYSY